MRLRNHGLDGGRVSGWIVAEVDKTRKQGVPRARFKDPFQSSLRETESAKAALYALAIAKAHGVRVPPILDTLGRDGCDPPAAPLAATNPPLLAATTAFLDEVLQCADANAAWRALAADPAVEVIAPP